VIRKIETLIDQGVKIDWPALARTLAVMQQHVLDDRVSPFAVLDDLLEIAFQHMG